GCCSQLRRRGRKGWKGWKGWRGRKDSAGRTLCFASPPAPPAHPASPALYNHPMLRPFRGVLPRVHESAFIDASAPGIGDVEIGEESSVWPHAVVRGDVHAIRIGRRTNVQDGTVVHVMRRTHPTTIGDDITIGHAAIIHGCTIEDQCLIGMGAILLNGCRI